MKTKMIQMIPLILYLASGLVLASLLLYSPPQVQGAGGGAGACPVSSLLEEYPGYVIVDPDYRVLAHYPPNSTEYVILEQVYGEYRVIVVGPGVEPGDVIEYAKAQLLEDAHID